VNSALTVAAIQYEALDGGVPANVPEHARLIEDAPSRGGRLVVFPELSLTGYDLELYGAEEAWVTQGDPRPRRERTSMPSPPSTYEALLPFR
jgi:5-aminopentanamidase